MTVSKVGIREFRAGLAHVVDAASPVAVTRHGETVGYVIPVRQDRAADAAALRALPARSSTPCCNLTEADADEMAEEFKTLRTGRH